MRLIKEIVGKLPVLVKRWLLLTSIKNDLINQGKISESINIPYIRTGKLESFSEYIKAYKLVDTKRVSEAYGDCELMTKNIPNYLRYSDNDLMSMDMENLM